MTSEGRQGQDLRMGFTELKIQTLLRSFNQQSFHFRAVKLGLRYIFKLVNHPP
jgi:hypothetical protein